MKNYVKPQAVAVDSMSEGVYMASGASDCWVPVNFYVEGGGEPTEVKGHIQCQHYASHDHHSSNYSVEVTFSVPVSNAQSLDEGTGTFKGSNTVVFDRPSHHEQECSDSFGFSVWVATPADKSACSITGVKAYGCNRDCGQHSMEEQTR